MNADRIASCSAMVGCAWVRGEGRVGPALSDVRRVSGRPVRVELLDEPDDRVVAVGVADHRSRVPTSSSDITSVSIVLMASSSLASWRRKLVKVLGRAARTGQGPSADP